MKWFSRGKRIAPSLIKLKHNRKILKNIAEKRREAKGKGEREKPECRVPKYRKERQESLPKWSTQRNRGKQ